MLLKDAIDNFSLCLCEYLFVLLLIAEHPPILCGEAIRTALYILDYKKHQIYKVALKYLPHYLPR